MENSYGQENGQNNGHVMIRDDGETVGLFEPLMVSEGSPGRAGLVISPFLTGCIRRTYAAIFSFMAGVMPPMPMLGRSLL
jgi:hypothetical protein